MQLKAAVEYVSSVSLSTVGYM